MSIQLKGLTFDTKVISELEKNLLNTGYCLEDFTFEKHKRPGPTSTILSGTYALGIEYEYTVSISGKKFSIIFSDDSQFAHFFLNLCCADIADKPGDSLLNKFLHKVEHSIEVTKHWLTEDPFKS